MTNPSQVPVNCSRGAPMGRTSSHYLEGPVTLSNVVLSDGYDEGGAYWGVGTTLWVAWDAIGNVQYFRAASLEAAKRYLIDMGVDANDVTFEEQSYTLYWHAFDCPTDDVNCGSAPSDAADNCTCDCGEYIEKDAIFDTETETVWPITLS